MDVLFGPERLARDLREEGYADAKVVRAADDISYVVTRTYQILHGRFADQMIGLGLLATGEYPRTIGSSIHVLSDPVLLDYSDSVPQRRNIIASGLGPEWRYWSYNFNWNGERSTRRLLSQINEIFRNV